MNIYSLAEFYKNKLDYVPDNVRKNIGHFNVFNIEDFIQNPSKPIPYRRKDYYKISLNLGNCQYHYADKSIEIKNAGIVFANPMIPYKIERIGQHHAGYFCVFTEAFMSQIPNIKEYPVFKLGAFPIYELTETQVADFKAIFEQMTLQIGSEYAYKYDLLRTLVLQMIHKTMMLNPNNALPQANHSANQRITSLFAELLERQFPIEYAQQRMRLRIPADFAAHLSVHINHLNRALKTVTGKTTSMLIAERILQEACSLLRHTDWNISEIGYCLGFEEPSHFIAFFKRSMDVTPKVYRH
ncbi:AraC-type DNA-binding protein [Flexibacter flexilis DSM 6793]|uniref:AraC-type DNA-binding protein n=1 Tax=Flexibacter flexilis DSM 6793 TaxID=927664 RepID=A0A1I1DC72_9BACT|nr:response regulator transcription factor [Flexibacter flexilis]SFB70400.1 AraC-type DNA-binding protein [Flexibacter flexilis DSM 6793]